MFGLVEPKTLQTTGNMKPAKHRQNPPSTALLRTVSGLERRAVAMNENEIRMYLPKRAGSVEAIRYWPGKTCQAIADWIGDAHDEEDCFEDAEYYVWDKRDRMTCAEPGYWIVLDYHNGFIAMSDREFHERYEEAPLAKVIA